LKGLKSSIPAAFNACGVQGCAFNCLRRSRLRVQYAQVSGFGFEEFQVLSSPCLPSPCRLVSFKGLKSFGFKEFEGFNAARSMPAAFKAARSIGFGMSFRF